MEPYANYLDKFIKALEKLKEIAPTVNSVDDLIDENEQAKFVIAFRDLIKLKNILESFSEFDNVDIKLDEQEFANYTSKYLDIKDKVDTRKTKEKVSVLEDLDFELELIQKIEVNVHYILTLLGQLNDGTDEQKAKKKQDIYNIINTNEKLRSKRELIEKFINENLANITNSDLVEEEFEKFWNEEQIKELDEICKSENLHEDKVKDLIENHIYTAKEIQTFDVSDVLITQPSILTRKTITDRVLDRLKDFINRFHNL
jgi:type I restriction enzyme R subunit